MRVARRNITIMEGRIVRDMTELMEPGTMAVILAPKLSARMGERVPSQHQHPVERSWEISMASTSTPQIPNLIDNLTDKILVRCREMCQ